METMIKSNQRVAIEQQLGNQTIETEEKLGASFLHTCAMKTMIGSNQRSESAIEEKLGAQ